jgi:hypothetical protein
LTDRSITLAPPPFDNRDEDEILSTYLPTIPTPVDINKVTLDTLDNNSSCIPIVYNQMISANYWSVDLCSICSQLFVKGCKNVKKLEMIQSILPTYNNKLANASAKENSTVQNNNSPCKEIHCIYHLIKEISEKICNEFTKF